MAWATLRAALWSQEAKSMTASVVETWVDRRLWLAQRMVNGKVHGPVYGRQDGGRLLAAVLVASLY